MRGDCANHFLKVYVEYLAPEDGEDLTFLLSARLRKRGHRPIPGEPLRTDEDPVVLQCASLLLEAFAERAFAAGYLVRVDLSKAGARDGPWPRWCISPPQFVGLMESLLPGPEDHDHIKIYPVAMWFVPRGSSKAESVVEAFRALPLDDRMFSEVLRTGVFRLALFDAFFDLLSDPFLGESITQWMRAAAQTCPAIQVDWEVKVGD